MNTGRICRYYYCLAQHMKERPAKSTRKDEIETRIETIIETVLGEPELLASLAVDLADHHKQTTDAETRPSRIW